MSKAKKAKIHDKDAIRECLTEAQGHVYAMVEQTTSALLLVEHELSTDTPVRQIEADVIRLAMDKLTGTGAEISRLLESAASMLHQKEAQQ